MKTCSDCKLTKALTDFYQISLGSYSDTCKACHDAAYVKHISENPKRLTVLLWQHAQRARKYNAEVVDKIDADSLLKHFGLQGIEPYRCAYCGSVGDTLDHVYPLSRGGWHTVSNIVPCCRECNTRKSTKHPRRFLASSVRAGGT